jgi:hypothetical protein
MTGTRQFSPLAAFLALASTFVMIALNDLSFALQKSAPTV